MDSSKEQEEEAHAFLDRTTRPTRGKRMTKLLDEEIEEDELFWNQEALKDEENDVNYEEEQEVADEFDSDFDEDVRASLYFLNNFTFFSVMLNYAVHNPNFKLNNQK
nr:swr1 complex subunit 2 [Quercus suber]